MVFNLSVSPGRVFNSNARWKGGGRWKSYVDGEWCVWNGCQDCVVCRRDGTVALVIHSGNNGWCSFLFLRCCRSFYRWGIHKYTKENLSLLSTVDTLLLVKFMRNKHLVTGLCAQSKHSLLLKGSRCLVIPTA